MVVRPAAFNYGSGNVRPACRVLEHAGAEVKLASNRDAYLNADGLFVPRVGVLATVVAQLHEANGPNIIEHRLSEGRSVIGVYVGLRVILEPSEGKSEAEGLMQWPGVVRRLNAPVIPHVSRSPVEAGAGSMLFSDVEDQRFCFVHSCTAINDPAAPFDDGYTVPPLMFWTGYGNSRFVVVVGNGPLCGA